VAVAAAGVYARSEYRLRATFDVPEHAPLRLAADSVTLARGRRVADVRGCTDCHGARLEGRVLMDNPLVGRLAPPNLTAGRGGRGGELVPADWERAVRHGVRRDGRSLFVMPAQDYNGLSDEDLAALVSYARTVPSVDNAPPTSRLGPLGRVLFVAGKLPAAPAEIVGHARPHPTAVVAAATPQYGAYLAATCAGCHNERFTGGAHPGGPPGSLPAANITGDPVVGIGRWTEAQFVTALRTARRPDGTVIDSTQMPIAMTRQMNDTELRALYQYLQTVRPAAVAAR
jgi:mono/diheme cytochrome c family protein